MGDLTKIHRHTTAFTDLKGTTNLAIIVQLHAALCGGFQPDEFFMEIRTTNKCQLPRNGNRERLRLNPET